MTPKRFSTSLKWYNLFELGLSALTLMNLIWPSSAHFLSDEAPTSYDFLILEAVQYVGVAIFVGRSCSELRWTTSTFIMVSVLHINEKLFLNDVKNKYNI